MDADSSPVVVANEADLRLRQIFPVFESGMGRSSAGNQPITFLRPDQVLIYLRSMDMESEGVACMQLQTYSFQFNR